MQEAKQTPASFHVLGLLALVGTTLQSRAEVVELVAKLRMPAEQRDAQLALTNSDPEIVVPVVLEALSAAREPIGLLDWRTSAYEVLADVGGSTPTSISNPVWARALLDGLDHEKQPIRSICLRSLPRLDPLVAPNVVERACEFLAAPSPPTVASACSVLGEMGSRAKSALPILEEILKSESEYWQTYWAETRSSKLAHRRDSEFLVRHHAASVRTRIAGPGVDLDLYPRLDRVGKEVAIRTLMLPIFAIDNEKVTVEKISRVELRKAVAFLSSVPTTPELRDGARNGAIGLLGIVAWSPTTDTAIRLEARRALDKLASSEDPRIQEEVARVVEQLGG